MDITENGMTENIHPDGQTKRQKHSPRLHHQINNNSKESLKKKLTEIVFITSFPPRECGIATYSMDLVGTLRDKFGESFNLTLYPLESNSSKHRYDESIEGVLNTDLQLDFLQAAYYINSNVQVGLVVIQHEFGLFNNNENSFYEFLEYLDKPIVLTFHTVLPMPSEDLKKKVAFMGKLAAHLIVMTQNSSRILREDYGIPSNKVTVIAHGTHLIDFGNKNKLKTKHGLEGRTVLSTFGLLGPGKSIETTLDALPSIVEYYPKVIFLIIGRTHPNLVKEQGEVYREFLETKVKSLGLSDHVRFIDQFVPLRELLKYLKLTDIYLFTSKDPHQAVSGTFAYALSSGCPIISTPIPHAVEVLKNGAGSLFDFENSRQLQEAIMDLLGDEEKKDQMSLNGLQTSYASAWENAGISHVRVFEKVIQGSLILKYRKPPINLKHLKKMTTNIGVIQFSKINEPDLESGYTLDDNARALIAICKHYELTGDTTDLKYIKTYFNFIFSCFRHDCKFLNYVNKDYEFTDQNKTVNLEDAGGRAIWALGYLLSMSWRFPEDMDPVKDKALFVFKHALEAMQAAHSPRAIAFILKGLHFYNRINERECVNKLVTEFADRLVSLYKKESDENWQWFEGYLTYGNSVLPESLLMAYSMTSNPDYRRIAKSTFDFLLAKIFKDGTIAVISNQNWYTKGEVLDTEFKGGQQPIDVAYTIIALRYFHKLFPQEGYNVLSDEAFDWFMGKNPLNQIIYNPCTGGCHDGLEMTNVNLNQGAESTISYLLARMAFENFKR
ncbi:glycosyltransferase [Sediminicola sp. 1XM1-17]|uniref:glycosyltransferase n=1 Tax=Sediminicola sp. 1XM1-17 TaxID=3127702 RepID=UPI003077E9D0